MSSRWPCTLSPRRRHSTSDTMSSDHGQCRSSDANCPAALIAVFRSYSFEPHQFTRVMTIEFLTCYSRVLSSFLAAASINCRILTIFIWIVIGVHMSAIASSCTQFIITNIETHLMKQQFLPTPIVVASCWISLFMAAPQRRINPCLRSSVTVSDISDDFSARLMPEFINVSRVFMISFWVPPALWSHQVQYVDPDTCHIS